MIRLIAVLPLRTARQIVKQSRGNPLKGPLHKAPTHSQI